MSVSVTLFRLQRCLAIISIVWLAGIFCGLSQEANGENSSSSEAITTRLKAVRKELAELPAETTADQRESLRQLEASTDFQLTALDLLAAAQDKLAKAKQASASWSGFAQPPPYSILLLDEAREFLAAANSEEGIAQAQLSILKSELESLRDDLTRHQKAERRLLEVAEQATDPDASATARQQAKMDNLAARIIAEKTGRNQLGIAIMQARLATAAAQSELNKRKIKAIGDQTVFTQQDLDGLHQQIGREREEINRSLTSEPRKENHPNTVLTWKLQFLDHTREFWDARFIAINSKEPAKVRDAIATLKLLQGQVDNWAKISELRLVSGDEEAVNLDPAQLREVVQQVRVMQRRIGFAVADLDGWSLRERGRSLIDKTGGTLLALWNAELYVVEETDIVDGKKVPSFRPITVGKLVRLAFILVVGWLLLRFLSRRIKTAILRKGQIPQSTADLAGKWAFGIGLLLLVLYAFHAVRIPLTIFAFLGGALAIGVGFGTQTLLKNFISGIILLLERPLKVGDVIEVANITGAIKFIGVRASVIQHSDGIETLVPNSVLLENQLTNWTFSNTVIRHSILVGVAYGSPTRDVAHLLLSVAKEHGLVKDEPAPEVRFDNFADNSLTFSLLFWFDTQRTNRGSLASDLRFMIDKAFAEAGITIAFPQRDLHFDPETPLRVELSRSAKKGRRPCAPQ